MSTHPSRRMLTPQASSNLVTTWRNQLGSAVMPFAVVLIISIHGWYRLYEGSSKLLGRVLEAEGILFPYFAAHAVTWLEAFASPLLLLPLFVNYLPSSWRILQKGVPWLCLVFITMYVGGIVMFHAADGWFVVGAGRGGSEFSVLLIACLAAIGLRANT